MLDEVFEREPKKILTTVKKGGGNPRAKPRITHTNTQVTTWMHISCNLIVKYKIYVCVVLLGFCSFFECKVLRLFGLKRGGFY